MAVTNVLTVPDSIPNRQCPLCHGAAWAPPVTTRLWRAGRIICAGCRLTDLECGCLTQQRELFEQEPPTDPDSIGAAFRRFHSKHPEVYMMLARLARQALARGRKRLGIKMLFEVVRWEHYLEYGDRQLKLNNNYSSRYARLLMDREDDLDGVFALRALQTE